MATFRLIGGSESTKFFRTTESFYACEREREVSDFLIYWLFFTLLKNLCNYCGNLRLSGGLLRLNCTIFFPAAFATPRGHVSKVSN